eukprot:TRINITY_DN104694_c0_g1_i1.p1 TRINITY_DN104694_c0_g1~~TRINITY_DN104694_c0_g1_i1.p1  ORF type:complete len:450 (+),score=111.18 TRINITY_DN104694_c0_g1_i1:26-1351(+)
MALAKGLAVLPATFAPSLSAAPRDASDKHELKAVLAAQNAELESLKSRLADVQRESTRLRHKLRDMEGELSVATDATVAATDRLSAQSVRQGLVLSAGVERCGAERAKLEEELQHMEGMLCERDAEIQRLRHVAGTLESNQLQLELEMRGLHAAHENAASEVRQLSANVASLLHDKVKKTEKVIESSGKHTNGSMHSSPFSSTSGPHSESREQNRLRESAHLLLEKQKQHAALKHRSTELTAEARRMEAEEAAISHRVILFQQQLREKQMEMEKYDKHFVREGVVLRDHVDELRKALEHEQKSFIAADHLAALQPKTQEDVQKVKQEILSILAIMPELDTALRSRHQHVHSAEVPSDPLDAALHAVIRAGHEPTPALVCRLGPGDYIVGSEHVAILAGQGGTLLFRPAGRHDESFKAAPLAELFRHQAQHHVTSAHPQHHF